MSNFSLTCFGCIATFALWNTISAQHAHMHIVYTALFFWESMHCGTP